MVEFGAKLSLKDNMSATLQKNLKMQQQFSKQIKDTSNSVKSLAKQKIAPVIKVKDTATKVINKVKTTLKTIGRTVAKPFIALKDGATKALNKVKEGLKKVGSTVAKATVAVKDMATAGLNKIKNLLSSLAKGATIAVTVAGGAIVGGAINEGAKLEQSIGGVETLFKGDADIVKANADLAYKSAGLSANAYMETVTGFSASLLQSLGGDTAKSAEVANMAIIDMADNANKFGTDMSSIQTAYQGFAKQNYTMLDNLKLGYGGTKEEMQRLLADASKLSGVKYDISNLADVYNAIHVVQENLGVAGATAKEASTTFSGSFSAMKASAQNVLGNLAVGGDVTGSMEALVDSAMTFLVGNFIPMVGNIFKALPKAISTGIKSVAPQLKTVGGDLIKSLKDGIIGILPSSMQGVATSLFSSLGRVFNSVSGMLSSIAPKLAEKFSGVFGDGGGILDGITSAIEMAMPTIESLILGVADVIAVVAPVVGDLAGAFMEVFPEILSVVDGVVPIITDIIAVWGDVYKEVIPVATDIIKMFSGIIQQVLPIVSQIFSSVASVVMPIVKAVAGLIQTMMPIISNVISTVVGAVQAVLPTFISIFESIGSKVQAVVGVIQKHMPLISSIFETVSSVVGSTIGIITDVIGGFWDFLSPVVDVIIECLDFLLGGFDRVFPAIQTTVETVWGVLEKVFGWIADGLSLVGDAIKGVGEFVGDGLDSIANFFGFAYGKDRVPYDNYPAILHQGEKVLTRNQADQYDRQMSTRGVKLTEAIAEVPRDNGTAPTGTATDVSYGVKQANTGGTSVTIEKLADTVVIEKDADVDKVVEAMVNKFHKLLPNMP